MTYTYTYAIMHVSKETFAEVAAQLREAGYDHAFHDHDTCLDMNGLALRVEPGENKMDWNDARALAQRCGFNQMIVYARSAGEHGDGREQLVTWGSEAGGGSETVALIGKALKREVLKWGSDDEMAPHLRKVMFADEMFAALQDIAETGRVKDARHVEQLRVLLAKAGPPE